MRCSGGTAVSCMASMLSHGPLQRTAAILHSADSRVRQDAIHESAHCMIAEHEQQSSAWSSAPLMQSSRFLGSMQGNKAEVLHLCAWVLTVVGNGVAGGIAVQVLLVVHQACAVVSYVSRAIYHGAVCSCLIYLRSLSQMLWHCEPKIQKPQNVARGKGEEVCNGNGCPAVGTGHIYLTPKGPR